MMKEEMRHTQQRDQSNAEHKTEMEHHKECHDTDIARYKSEMDRYKSEIESEIERLQSQNDYAAEQRRRLCRALFRAPPDTEPQLKAMTVVRDEPGLIDSWLFYHSRIFGEKNLVVYDNCSKDPKHTSIYAKYPNINLRYTPHYTQGIHALDVSHGMAAGGILACLDVDEFMVLDGNADPQAIRAYLLTLFEQSKPCYSYGAMFETSALPAFDDDLEVIHDLQTGMALRVKSLDILQSFLPKIIVRAECVKVISDGYHLCDFPDTVQPRLGLMHFHKRPFMTHVQHCIMDLQGFGILPSGDIRDPQQGMNILKTLMAIPIELDMPGRHKFQFLREMYGTMNTSRLPCLEDYREWYERRPATRTLPQHPNVVWSYLESLEYVVPKNI
jgi:hypothetical protein